MLRIEICEDSINAGTVRKSLLFDLLNIFRYQNKVETGAAAKCTVSNTFHTFRYKDFIQTCAIPE